MTGELDSTAVRCPTCKAEPGEPCRMRSSRRGPSATSSGSPGRQEHLARFDRYFRTLDRRKPDGCPVSSRYWREKRDQRREGDLALGTGPWALLERILWRHVSLPGALCRGQAPRFDADQLDGESPEETRLRLAGAATICGRCPERVRCPAPVVADWLQRTG